VPAQRLDDCRCSLRGSLDLARRRGRGRRGRSGSAPPPRTLDRIEQLARRARARRGVIGQPDVEGTLDAQRELGARQAVEPEVAVDPVVEARCPRGLPRPQLAQHAVDDVEQPSRRPAGRGVAARRPVVAIHVNLRRPLRLPVSIVGAAPVPGLMSVNAVGGRRGTIDPATKPERTR